MKKLAVVTISILFFLLCACSDTGSSEPAGTLPPETAAPSVPAACTHPSHNPDTQLCDVCGEKVCHSYTGMKCACGKVFEPEDSFMDMSLYDGCAHPGAIEKTSYPSRCYAYEPYEETEKNMVVYLPYGYTDDNMYNVLFLLPGSCFDENYYFCTEHFYNGKTVSLKNMVDNMIDRKICEPVIIVCITCYGGSSVTADNLPVDSRQVSLEMRNDILPYVCNHFSTYGIDERSHFGFAGYSYGSVLTFSSAFKDCFDLFSYYGMWSGFIGYIDEITESVSASQLPCGFLYSCVGDSDVMAYDTERAYSRITGEIPAFCAGENCCLNFISPASHDWILSHNGLFDCLQLFF